MSGAILDANCDARASIEVQISPSSKGLPTYCGPPLASEEPTGTSITGTAPSSSPDAATRESRPLTDAELNEILIGKLFESLEALKQKSSRHNSGATSPSPLTVSTGGSADLVPSSPTGVAHYDFSPGQTLSREESTDCLAAAVQQLSLGQQGRSSVGISHHTTPRGVQNVLSSAPWVPNAPLPMQGHSVQQVTPSQMQHLGHHSYLGMQTGFNTMFPGTMSYGMTNQFASQTAGTAASVSHLHAMYTGQAAAQHVMGLRQSNVNSVFAPGGILTQFEECLIGLDGAYQSYCRQIISEDINAAACRMLNNLKALQIADSPAVSRLIGKRYFCSLKEVSKVVSSARLLLVAPDVRPSATAHIKPVRLLQMVLAAADVAGVPYVFCLSRRGIGQVFGRDKSMSIVAVMHLEGVESEYLSLLENAARGREVYARHRQPKTNMYANTALDAYNIGLYNGF